MYFHPDIVRLMAFGVKEERVICPICKGVKQIEHVVCLNCISNGNIGMIKEEIFKMRKNPSEDIWKDLIAVVKEMLSADVKPELISRRLKISPPKGKEYFSFLHNEVVEKAIRFARNRDEKFAKAIDFLRNYLVRGGRYNADPSKLASNAINSCGGNSPHSHGLLTVVAAKVIIPEEAKKASQALQAAVEKNIRKAKSGSIGARANFVASRETKMLKKKREESNTTAPVMA